MNPIFNSEDTVGMPAVSAHLTPQERSSKIRLKHYYSVAVTTIITVVF